jgi:hypothetical protein
MKTIEQIVMSLTAQLHKLEIGESVARVERYDLYCPPVEGMGTVLNKMRQSVNVLTSCERKRTGKEFRVTSGIMVADNNDALVAVVVVTRI